MKERLAPGHVYLKRLGSGIEWQPGQVNLWENGVRVAQAAHQYSSAYQYFYHLAFAESFPDVTHWWFRSAWTQRVRLTTAQGAMEGETVWGYMQFVDETVPARMWTATNTELPIIEVPYPPNEVHPVNLPLRLALSWLVVGILTEEVQPNAWLLATSLIPAGELQTTIPVQQSELPFSLGGATESLRDTLCNLQGLFPAAR